MQLAWNCKPVFPSSFLKKVTHLDIRKPFFIAKKKKKKKKKNSWKVINANVNGNQHTARRNQLFLMTFLQSLTHFKSFKFKTRPVGKKIPIKCYSSVPNCFWSNCKFGEPPPSF